MIDAREDELERAVLDVFGVRASFREHVLPKARRVQLGMGRALFVDSSDLRTLALVRRFTLREIEHARRHAAAERRFATLKAKTSRLIPGVEAGGAALEDWNLASAELPLLERFDGFAVIVGRRLIRQENLPDADVETTLRVLDKHSERSISVRGGELFGVRVADVCVVVLSDVALESVDRELVALQATWVHRMCVEQTNLRRLDGLRGELADKNAALADALETARHAVAVRSKFLAHMSHEIRTPLNGIVGIAQILLEGALTEDQRDLLDVQMESSRWLREVIDAVLDLSKLDAGSMQLDLAPFDLHALVSSAVRGTQPLTDEQGLDLVLEVHEALPRCVTGDAVRVRQALLNLLSNAVKFSGSAAGTGVEREVRVEVLPEGAEGVRFVVHDRGIGVPEARREAIFEPFVQAEASTTRRYGGTGLGLPLVRSFARLHGGDAGMTPRPGGGSSFFFTACLPLARLDEAESVDTARADPRALRVLLVEDQPVNQMVVRRLLERRGHSVDVAGDGAQALECIEAAPPFDLVLMDRMMPVMDGIEATTRIRANPVHGQIPVYALTASVTTEERAACLAAGMDGVLAKPVQLDELVLVIGVAAARAEAVSPR